MHVTFSKVAVCIENEMSICLLSKFSGAVVLFVISYVTYISAAKQKELMVKAEFSEPSSFCNTFLVLTTFVLY